MCVSLGVCLWVCVKERECVCMGVCVYVGVGVCEVNECPTNQECINDFIYKLYSTTPT